MAEKPMSRAGGALLTGRWEPDAAWGHRRATVMAPRRNERLSRPEPIGNIYLPKCNCRPQPNRRYHRKWI